MNSSRLDYASGIQLLGGVEVTLILPVVLSGIIFIGFAGHLLILVILIHDFRNGKGSVANTLNASLSVADLLILTLCVPIRAVTYSRQSWTLGRFVCKTSDWFQNCCLVAKSFTLAGMNQARYDFILNPSRFIHFNPTRVIAMLISIWIASSVLPIPFILFSSLQQHNGVNLCVFETPSYASNFMNVFSKIYPVAVYLIPIIVSVTYYTRTILQTKQRINKEPNPWSHRIRFTVMLVCLHAVYALMWLPEWTAWLWARNSHSPSHKPPAGFAIFAQVFLYLSSTINPILFLALSEDFRQGLINVWLFLTCDDTTVSGNRQYPKTEENGAEIESPVTNSLQELKPVSSEAIAEIPKDTAARFLPDLEHFWQERGNTSATEESDPVPWERVDNQ